MGYDIHITRADDWVESEEAPISAAEWTTFVEASSDLRWEAERPWAHMEVDRAIWTGHPDTEAEPWLALLRSG